VFHGTTTIATLLGTFDQNPGQDNWYPFWTRNYLLNFNSKHW
jgi:hypothetical protein